MKTSPIIIPYGPWNGTAVEDLPDHVLYQLATRSGPWIVRPIDLAVEHELERRALERRRIARLAA